MGARSVWDYGSVTNPTICSSFTALAALAAGNPAAAAAAAAAAHGRAAAAAQSSQQQTHEMTVPNELIGCIIGKGGSKIAEIR